MKNVALVSFTSKEYNRGFLTRGLLYLGTILKDKGYNVKLFQRTLLNIPLKEFINLILDFNPEFIGVSLTESNCVRDNIWAINEIKKRKENIKIIVGGPHVTAVKGEVFEYLNCDFAFYGEAEKSFPQFIEKYPYYKKIKGIIYKQNGKIITNPPSGIIENLDDLPFPDYNILYGINRLKKKLTSRENTLQFTAGFNYIHSARGCPYRCAYCLAPSLYKRFRSRSPTVIVDEIEYNLKLFKTPYIAFGCDNFTYDKKWATDICKEIIKRGLKIKFIIDTRIDLLDKEIIKILKAAGCILILTGVETGSGKMLKRYRKNIRKDMRFEDYVKIVKLLKKNGIKLSSYIILGGYEENLFDTFKTVLLLMKLGSSQFMQIFSAYPGTKLYCEYVKKKIIDKHWYVKSSKCNMPRDTFYLLVINILRILNNKMFSLSTKTLIRQKNHF